MPCNSLQMDTANAARTLQTTRRTGSATRSRIATRRPTFTDRRISMKLPTLLTLGCASSLLAACNLLHDGPGSTDVDAAVRRALEAENHGGLNALFGQPLPVSADVISAKPDGDCRKLRERTYACDVVVTWRNTDYAPSRANLTFVQAADGSWQTSGVDAALATGAAKSLIDKIGNAWPGNAASGASARQ
ncbi:hypothetical protein BDAG_01581 [Burkholderia dolosa AU0158]|nr:hypothetical protein BDAG_01581 [Burkholderia dolosa AU0158]